MPKNDTVRVGFLGVGVIAGLHFRRAAKFTALAVTLHSNARSR